MRAFLSSAFYLYLSYKLTLSVDAPMASTRELTSERTSPVSGGASLSMSFSRQRLTENRLSTVSSAASGGRSSAVVIAIRSRSALAHRARGANHGIPHRPPPSPETTGASRQLWSQKKRPVCLARAHLAWSSSNHMDVDTLESSACPLAGWLVSRHAPGHHLLSVPVGRRTGHPILRVCPTFYTWSFSLGC